MERGEQRASNFEESLQGECRVHIIRTDSRNMPLLLASSVRAMSNVHGRCHNLFNPPHRDRTQLRCVCRGSPHHFGLRLTTLNQ